MFQIAETVTNANLILLAPCVRACVSEACAYASMHVPLQCDGLSAGHSRVRRTQQPKVMCVNTGPDTTGADIDTVTDTSTDIAAGKSIDTERDPDNHTITPWLSVLTCDCNQARSIQRIRRVGRENGFFSARNRGRVICVGIWPALCLPLCLSVSRQGFPCLTLTRHHRYMDSPYHNSRHAADVTQGMYYLLAFGGSAHAIMTLSPTLHRGHWLRSYSMSSPNATLIQP